VDSTPSAAGLIDGRFDIGGRSLYLHCAGSGSPTIILEPGDGDRPDAMRPLATELGRDHRICTYDRANMGQSDPAPFQRPVQALADDLDALLTAAGVDGPFLPVGTSLGGLAAWLFSVAHPDRVAGFVAINPPTDMDVWLPAVKPLITQAEYADEVAYSNGSLGNERYVNSGWIDRVAPPASMPYAIVDSTTTQCEGDPLCLKVYDVIEAQTADMATRGAGGRWVQVPGSHQLQASNTDDVLAVIREVLGEANP
jgi:pimeloyl-ACP methyl ester carboxylesterase